jgi:hypothetical protein
MSLRYRSPALRDRERQQATEKNEITCHHASHFFTPCVARCRGPFIYNITGAGNPTPAGDVGDNVRMNMAFHASLRYPLYPQKADMLWPQSHYVVRHRRQS